MPGLLDLGKRAGQALTAGFFTAAGQILYASAAGQAAVGYPGWTLNAAGLQSAVTVDNTEKSLLGSTLNIPPRFAAGDVLRIDAIIEAVQNSGATRTWTPRLKLGGTAIASGTISPAASASTRIWRASYLVRMSTTATQRIYAEHNYNLWQANGSGSGDATASVDMTSAVALDFTVQSSVATTTQTATLQQIAVVHLPLAPA